MITKQIDSREDYERAHERLEVIFKAKKGTPERDERKILAALVRKYEKEHSLVPEEGITIEQYNKELEEAEAEIERGEFYTHEEVMQMAKDLINGKKVS